MKKRKMMLLLIGILLIVGVIYFGRIHFKMTQYADTEPPQHADYLIILGAKVNSETPSLALQYRIDAAAVYAKENENTILIASGGQGPGEDITEAESMRRKLVDKGISESRIFLEDRSTSTYENIKFSKRFIPEEAKLGIIVTNDYHLYRSVQIARDAGLTVEGLPAKTPQITLLKAYIREYLSVTKYYLEKYILK
ncbi:YdcF family protein [Bacillus timonensis]|uniref:YdcF family protein n=1 Tax=Bacillus timonensis TaxID=1033734 RepID=A0A4V3V801_9BACI|nr:YdcF family protein [Bacillus timonensis]THE13293.1 YdcF family protein [Bacillus timonensis]